MFDSATAKLLRSAPGMPGLNPESIPAMLTSHYASLVSARLRGGDDIDTDSEEEWTLERIADAYELITSIHSDASLRKASAFVAATAQQILARRQADIPKDEVVRSNIDRGSVDPTIAAVALFLAAEQYADANEAASVVKHKQGGQLYEATILSESIVDLARGRHRQILERASRWRRPRHYSSLDEKALVALLEALITGVEVLAAQFLAVPVPEASAGRFESPRDAFMMVLKLSSTLNSYNSSEIGGDVLTAYPGPFHMASLLMAAYDGIKDAALTSLPPPNGADPKFWKNGFVTGLNNFLLSDPTIVPR